eukprot:Em0014g960a
MQSDLDVKVEELDSTKLLNTFNWYWNKELERKKRGKPARLGLAIVMCVWWRLIVQGALTFCEIGVQVLQSVVTGLLSQYFVEEYSSSTDTRNAYIYAACLVATALVITVLHSIALFIGQKIGLIVRATITAAIHQKIMTLNQATVGLVSAGHVVNLASNDAQRFDQAFIFVHQLWLGLASLIPVEVILIALPIQVLLFRAFSSERFNSAIWTDNRIKIMNEIISGMRVIKMYGWEDAFRRVVNQIRSKESISVLKAGLLSGSNLAIEYMTVPVMMFGIFSVHMATGGNLTTRNIFTTLSMLTLIQRNVMRLYIKGVFLLVEANVAVSRIKAFMELADGNLSSAEYKDYIVQNNTGSKIDHDKQPLIAAKYIEAKQVHTNWSGIDDEKMTLQNISFTVNKDAPFLAVVGPVGSGKSTLLQCVLGELHPVHGTVDVKGKIAYASQDPWLFTGTLRENVLFGCPLYVDWYDAVLDACALHQDIEQLPNGDLTLIGERGVDVEWRTEGKVDAVVAQHIFERCICGLLKDRLVVLVTHQLQFAEQANNILALNDGKMVAYGNIQHLRANRVNSEKLLEFKKDDQSNGKSGTDEKSGNSNTVRKATANKSEERSHGNIKAQTYIQYFKMGAGPVNILLVFGMLGLGEVTIVQLYLDKNYANLFNFIGKPSWNNWQDWSRKIFTYSDALQNGRNILENISIDGVNIRDVELHELRKSISIIPQDPVLFSGSLKYNLDPFEEYKDSELWNVLEQATHRLNTVIGLDRIMVMDEGEIAEFDDPYMLLKDESHCLKRWWIEQAHLIQYSSTKWPRGKPAAFDFTVLLPYHLPSYLRLVLTQVQPPDQPRNASTELTNDVKCAELGWSCVPLAVRPMEPGVMRHNAPFLTWLLLLSVGSAWPKVGETLRRLVGKCLCQITKGKASDYFSTHQFGVACPSGAEKIVHGLRSCIEEHQNEQDFVVMKIDVRNAFNLVSRQALLDECRAHFPELLQWAAWCYGQHYLLWSPMETIMSESGVQQGDPLGPLLFCLVLQKVLSAIASDPIFFDLLFHAWYIDVGVISGSKQAVVQALSIIQDLGPPLGLVINSSKCELYGDCDLQPFPSEMKKCNAFNFEILGAPIGDTIFCAKFIAEKRAGASKFLALLKEVGSLDSQVALVLLRQCGGFCRFVHIAVSGDCLSIILSSSFFSLSLANWRKTLSK